MDLTWAQFFGLALTSGAAAGLANQLFKFGHDWIAERRTNQAQGRELEHQKTMQNRELRHQRDLQEEEREHQASVRREGPFFEAQRHLLGDAVATDVWVNWWWGDLYGEETDYFVSPLAEDAVVRTGEDAIRALARISGSHPSRDIRLYARRLSNVMDTRLHQPDHYGSTQPSRQEIAAWKERTEELIESMHDPDHAPVESDDSRSR